MCIHILYESGLPQQLSIQVFRFEVWKIAAARDAEWTTISLVDPATSPESTWFRVGEHQLVDRGSFRIGFLGMRTAPNIERSRTKTRREMRETPYWDSRG